MCDKKEKVVEKRESSKFYLNLLGVKMKYYDPNPYANLHDDPEDRQDCVIRAISKILSKSWKEVYEDLSKIGLELGIPMNHSKAYTLYLSKYGYIDISDILYEQKDVTTIGQFMNLYKNTISFVSDEFHAVAYIDGEIYDNKAHIDNFDINYFLIDEFQDIFVRIDDDTLKDVIEKKFSKLEELSSIESRVSDKILLSTILENLNYFRENPELEIGNMYKYYPIPDVYYLLIDIDKEQEYLIFAVCTSKCNDYLSFKTVDETVFHVLNDHSIIAMKDNVLGLECGKKDFHLCNNVYENTVKLIKKYLEDRK